MKRLLIDTNILVLLLVGTFKEKLVGTHRRCRDFDLVDLRLVQSILGNFDDLVLCSNTLTEVSNLLRQTGEPDRSGLMLHLARVLDLTKERFVPASRATQDAHFPRLGLTDVSLLDLCAGDTLLLTVDLDLYLEAERRSLNAVNLRHYREQIDPR